MPSFAAARHGDKSLIFKGFAGEVRGRLGRQWTPCVTVLTGIVKRPSFVTRAAVAYDCRPLAFERVARLSDLPPDRGLCVRVLGLEIGLYRVGDRVYALENACPHAGYPLHEGELQDRIIICAGHGFDYDLETGLPPGTTGDHPLARYPVELRGNDIYLDASRTL